MHLLVTSASGINGAGYGKLLAFDGSGQLLGPFTEDTRVSDPRGLGTQGGLLFLNSGADRILALDGKGQVVRDSGVIAGLNPGGGNFGPDGRYYVGARNLRTIMAFEPALASVGEPALPPSVVPFPRGFAFGNDGTSFWRPVSVRAAKATTQFWHSIRKDELFRRGRWPMRSSARSISPSRQTEMRW
jgi:hypothetical protein